MSSRTPLGRDRIRCVNSKASIPIRYATPETGPALGNMFNLTVDYVAERTDHASFDRGQKIDPERVDITERSESRVAATVTAPHEYHVILDLHGTDVVAECTCTIQHEWCRHAVATALKLVNQQGEIFSEKTREREAHNAVTHDPLDEFIANISHDELVEVVRDLRVAQPRIDLALELAAALHGGGEEAVAQRLTQRVTRLSRKNPGWSARLTAEVAQEWFELLDVCAVGIDRGWGAQLVVPLEDATQGIGEMLLRTDDAYGVLADAYRTAILLHLAAYRQAPPAPPEVVEWISSLVFEESGFGEPDLEDYGEWLDVEAIDELEHRVEKQDGGGRYDDSLEYLREGIARLRGDDTALEQMLTGDELLEFYEQRNREDDARLLLTEAATERVSKKRLGLGGTGVSMEALTSRLDRYWGPGTLLKYRHAFAKSHPGRGFRELLATDGVTPEITHDVIGSAPSWLRANLQLMHAIHFDDFDLGYQVAMEHPRKDELDPELISEMGTVIGVNVDRAKGTELMFRLVEHFAEAGDLPSYKRMESELRDIRKFVTDDAAALARYEELVRDLRERYSNRAAVREIIDRV